MSVMKNDELFNTEIGREEQVLYKTFLDLYGFVY